MSRCNLRRPRWLLVVVALSACLGLGRLQAQTPERTEDGAYLDRARRENEVASQKIEADVRAALRDALADPARAVERLRRRLAELEEDTVLPEKRRAALVRMLKDRIRVAQAPAEPDTGASAVHREAARRRLAEAERARQPRDKVRSPQPADHPEEAGPPTRVPAPVNADDPAAQGANRVRAEADRLSTERRLQRQRERGTAALARDFDQSVLPPVGDVDYPKDWAVRSQRRKRYSSTPLTTKEKAILGALAAPVTVHFKDSRFEEAIETLSKLCGQPIMIDRNALKDADVGYDTPVNAHLKGVSLRTVLRKILGEYGLAYVVKNEAIQITTGLKAREMMVTRAYPISDLVVGVGPLGGTNGLFLGPAAQQAQAAENIKHLIDLIQTSVEPDSWRANGGTGTIVFNTGTMSLVVKQSAEVHAMLAGGVMP